MESTATETAQPANTGRACKRLPVTATRSELFAAHRAKMTRKKAERVPTTAEKIATGVNRVIRAMRPPRAKKRERQ